MYLLDSGTFSPHKGLNLNFLAPIHPNKIGSIKENIPYSCNSLFSVISLICSNQFLGWGLLPLWTLPTGLFPLCFLTMHRLRNYSKSNLIILIGKCLVPPILFFYYLMNDPSYPPILLLMPFLVMALNTKDIAAMIQKPIASIFPARLLFSNMSLS